MSMLSRSLAVGTVALVLAATPAKAQLWYNGNWDGSNTLLLSERSLWVPDSRVYDDFLVAGKSWRVTSLFGDFLSDLAPTQGYWEIRSGVSAGNGGSLLFSGVSDLTWALLGSGTLGYDEYRATIGGLNFILPAGIYWLAIAPMSSGEGRAYLAGTTGANGVNSLLDGNSYWDSQTYGKNFSSTSPPFASSPDFAYGVNGTLVNPEPGSLVLMATGLGLIALGLYRRRRSAQG